MMKFKLNQTKQECRETVINTPVNDGRFICKLCHHLIYEGRECDMCGEIICGFCMAELRQTQHACPGCRRKFQPNLRGVNKYFKMLIDQHEFQCPSCKKYLFYEAYCHHIEHECAGMDMNCPNGCGLKIKRNERTTHNRYCKNMLCASCGLTKYTENGQPHSCLKSFQEQLMELQSQMHIVQEENSVMRQEINTLKL
jgi:hypothetical protein